MDGKVGEKIRENKFMHEENYMVMRKGLEGHAQEPTLEDRCRVERWVDAVGNWVRVSTMECR